MSHRPSRAVAVLLLALLPGCAVTLHGQQTTGPGGTTTTTSSSLQGQASAGHARASVRFGAAPAPGASGGQLQLSRGGSAVLLIGVAVAGTVDWISQWLRPAAVREVRDDGPISQTCSCYGWQPALTPEATTR